MTAAQRATLEQMAVTAEHLARMSEDLPLAEQAYRNEADALRAALGTCGTCGHLDETETHAGYAFCAAPNTDKYPFRHKSMPLGERCSGWTEQEGA